MHPASIGQFKIERDTRLDRLVAMKNGSPTTDPERVFERPQLERGNSHSLSTDERQLLAVEVSE